MKIFVLATLAIYLLMASIASAEKMTEKEVSEALAQIPELRDLKILSADGYDDGSFYIILSRGNNRGAKISRYEIKDLEKYLAPKQLVIFEPEPRVVEKIIKVEIPGPECVVEKEVKVSVPGPTRFVIREALPTVVVAALFFISGRIAEDRYERSLEPEITKQIEPGHATVRIEYQGNDWLQRASDIAYAVGGITLSIPVFRRIF